jgi:bile acid:Na+ symporter, BASS family
MSHTLLSLTARTPHVLAAIFLVSMMVGLGLELRPVAGRAAKRRERRLVLRALVFNFAVVPLLAVVMARALDARGPVATALLLLAAAPGGRYAPLLARAAGGDASLAVEITLFANKLNALLSPLLAMWMLETRRASLHDATYILELLVLQLLPYFGARALLKRRPALAARLVRPARLAATAAALLLLAYLIAHRALRPALLLGPRGWLAVLLFGTVLLALGWLAGGREPANRRTFAVTAEARNLALALVLAAGAVGDERVTLAVFGAWLVLLAFAWLAVGVARSEQKFHGAGATGRA